MKEKKYWDYIDLSCIFSYMSMLHPSHICPDIFKQHPDQGKMLHSSKESWRHVPSPRKDNKEIELGKRKWSYRKNAIDKRGVKGKPHRVKRQCEDEAPALQRPSPPAHANVAWWVYTSLEQLALERSCAYWQEETDLIESEWVCITLSSQSGPWKFT